MSAPIDIPPHARASSSYYPALEAEGSSSSSGSASSSLDFAPKLYVPVHRRPSAISSTRSSMADITTFSNRSSISSDIFAGGRPAFNMDIFGTQSSLSSRSSFSHDSVTPVAERRASAPGVYSLAELLRLADSPLVRFTPESKVHIRDAVPEIVLSRRKAETKRWKMRHDEHERRHNVRLSLPDTTALIRPRISVSASSDDDRW